MAGIGFVPSVTKKNTIFTGKRQGKAKFGPIEVMNHLLNGISNIKNMLTYLFKKSKILIVPFNWVILFL